MILNKEKAKNFLKSQIQGRLRGSVGWVSNFGSGHDLAAREFKPSVGFCADSLEPASDSVSPSLSAPPTLTLCLSKNE